MKKGDRVSWEEDGETERGTFLRYLDFPSHAWVMPDRPENVREEWRGSQFFFAAEAGVQ